MKPKCCGTCKFSRWWLTPTGRIPKKAAGQCKAVFVEPILPACICKPSYHRVYVWQDYGHDCPLYKLNEGKPIAEGTP